MQLRFFLSFLSHLFLLHFYFCLRTFLSFLTLFTIAFFIHPLLLAALCFPVPFFLLSLFLNPQANLVPLLDYLTSSHLSCLFPSVLPFVLPLHPLPPCILWWPPVQQALIVMGDQLAIDLNNWGRGKRRDGYHVSWKPGAHLGACTLPTSERARMLGLNSPDLPLIVHPIQSDLYTQGGSYVQFAQY